jgi:glycosyltransferase involved in cell wall biosynthesis
LKTAIFHENFCQRGGAERVTEALHKAIPSADLLSTLTVKEYLSPYCAALPLKNTWMQWLPAKKKLFRFYFLLYPLAVETADLSAYDLVITSCYGYAKGVRRKPGAVHVCYCHNYMRWVWRYSDYAARAQFGPLKRLLIPVLIQGLKKWEMRAARRPDFYIANSNVVAERLRLAFGVSSIVIPPPVDTRRFTFGGKVEDYYLVLSRLVPHKRVDLAVQACAQSGRRLVVIGEGPDRARLETLAGPTVTFLGHLSDEQVNIYARQCRAAILPGEEDFGLTPLEINSAGRPVIAYKGGGALETVIDGLNGTFFDRPEPHSLAEAMDRLEASVWDTQAIRKHAEQFDIEVFQQRILRFLADRGFALFENSSVLEAINADPGDTLPQGSQ